MERLVIYTDGSCKPNPGIGGWAVVVERDGVPKLHASDGELDTTNNRMELTAAMKALEAFNGKPMEIWTDSKYLQQGISQWVIKWKRNGWKTATGSVKNVDIWQKLEELNRQNDVHWNWVRGHQTNKGNVIADQAAVIAGERFK